MVFATQILELNSKKRLYIKTIITLFVFLNSANCYSFELDAKMSTNKSSKDLTPPYFQCRSRFHAYTQCSKKFKNTTASWKLLSSCADKHFDPSLPHAIKVDYKQLLKSPIKVSSLISCNDKNQKLIQHFEKPSIIAYCFDWKKNKQSDLRQSLIFFKTKEKRCLIERIKI